MKSRWWLASCSAVLLVLSGGAVAAHSPQQDQNRNDQNREAKFNDHDRQAGKDWYNNHRSNLPKGFREQDRLAPELRDRLKVGVVLDSDLRGHMYPVPSDLLAVLTPPPAGCRYMVIDGQVVLLDRDWRVVDILDVTV
jgi:Ni/Co efflux regulator RcnB